MYDLSWSSNSLNLISGSVDNTAIVWDIKKGKHKAILTDHKGFVQGVAWDPKNQYLATLATDRYFRVFDVNTNKVVRRLNKSTYPVADTSPLFNKTIRLFHDDTMQTFYRRLCFSPDGELMYGWASILTIFFCFLINLNFCILLQHCTIWSNRSCNATRINKQ